MGKTMVDKMQPSLRSAIPGRERWNVRIVLNRPTFAYALAAMVMQTAGIRKAEANPFTGRILILFNPEEFDADIGSILHTAITQLMATASLEQTVAPPRNPIVRVVEQTHPDKSLIVKAAVASVATALASFLPGWGLTSILSVVQAKAPLRFLVTLGFKGIRSQMWVLGTFTTLAAGFSVLIRFFQKRLWLRLASKFESEIRTKVFAHVQTLDMAFFDNQTTGGLVHLVSGNASAIERFVEHAPGAAIEAATSGVIVILTLLFVSPVLTLTACAPLALIVLTSRYFQRRIAPLYAKLGSSTGEFDGRLNNSLAGIATVKSFTAEEYENERIGKESEKLRQSYEAATAAGLGYINLQMGVFTGITNFTMAVGAASVLAGGMSLTSFIALAQMIPMLFAAGAQVDSLYDSYQNAAAAAASVLGLLDTQPAILSGPRFLPPGALQGEVNYKNVSFAYQPGGDVLRDLSLHLRPGQTIGVVGATGAGKTTLLKLLLRFYEVRDGVVMVDGTDVREYATHDLRQSVSFVSQDVYLFDGTVFENIAYGKRDATREQVQEAARAAEAHEFIMKLPHGYDTLTGERGQRLSTGQRQRISIARAMIKDAPMLLLDEATAAVDNETEAAILRSLERLGAGRSMIIIAHRLSTVRNASRIFVLDEGQAREQGTHDELLAQDGLYASLWKVQTGSRH